jgi:hypothetical protein
VCSAFCQKPVNGLRNLSRGGRLPNFVFSAKISKRGTKRQTNALIFFLIIVE